MSEEVLDVVDEQDRFVRKALRSEAREKALLHMAARVIVVNARGKILVQKRAAEKDLYPGQWDVGIAETVVSGENYESAAVRGLAEEAGITGISESALMKSFCFLEKFRSEKHNSNCKVYDLTYDGEIKPDPAEVEEIRQVSAYEIGRLMEGPFAADGAQTVRKYLEMKPETGKSYVDVVDENDNVTGRATYEEANEKKLIFRAANVFVFNSEGKIFVHKRNRNLPTFPGLWDVKVGGIVDSGESYEEAAIRELKEEAGIEDVKLEPLFLFKNRRGTHKDNRMVYRCVYDGPLKLQKEEIEEGGFVELEEAKKLMDDGKISDSASGIFEEFLKNERARN